MPGIENLVAKISGHLSGYHSISLAYLFGSYARQQAIPESDLDIAVYFKTPDNTFEWESDTQYPEEDKLWISLERTTGKNIDLIVLNRAPSMLVYRIINEGIPLISKDENIRLALLSKSGFEALDFIAETRDWDIIKSRSFSLNEIDRFRLLKLIDFMGNELADIGHFTGLTWQSYQTDSDKRRNIERWTENLVNCSIDMAKILLASEKRPLPETYKEILSGLSILDGMSEDLSVKLAGFSRLRNFLAHEYLDSRFAQINSFLAGAGAVYTSFLEFVKKFIGATH